MPGLTADLFELFAGPEQLQITRFWGLEDDRPVDISFGVDLSGSMEVECSAVQQALWLFANTFEFRGRDARFGLVSFGDDLEAIHAPTASVKKFGKRLAKLSPNAGGMGEDATHAMVKATRLYERSNTERAFILVTDENLQVNRGGMKALGLKNNKECTKMASALKCVQKCSQRPSVKCFRKCIPKLGRSYKKAYDRCVKKGRRRWRKVRENQCLQVIPWNRITQVLSNCTSVVYAGSSIMEKLAEKLRKSAMRPFFLVPEYDAVTNDPIVGFDDLAGMIDGRVLHVPQDASEPGPYMAALFDIADQLSKQYVLRFKASGRNKKKGPLRVLVRHKHIWQHVGLGPPGSLIALFGIGGPLTCPHLVAVTTDRGILLRDSCDVGFEVLPGFTGTAVAATSLGAGIAVLSATGELHTVDPTIPQVDQIESGLVRVFHALIDPDGDLWVVGNDEVGHTVVRRRKKDEEDFATELPFSASPDATATALYFTTVRGEKRICLLAKEGTRSCYSKRTQAWTSAAGVGQPLFTNAHSPTVLTLVGRPEVVLITGEGGEVYRSADGGQHWQVVYQEGESAVDLVRVPGKVPALCVSSDRSVACSEDGGMTWFKVGHSYDLPGRGLLAVSGNRLFLTRSGQLERLDRVVRRDLPASSVFFETDGDRPLSSLHPFLKEYARELADDAQSFLRVEGHADHRGSDDYNEDLAARRAHNTTLLLQEFGAPPHRMKEFSFGERRPIRKGGGSKSLARNRRVELILTRPMPEGGWGADPCSLLQEAHLLQ